MNNLYNIYFIYIIYIIYILYIHTYILHNIYILYNIYLFYFNTSILAKLSTWCFEHSADISCSLLVNPSHTDESWEGRNTCMWIYTL